MWDVPFSAPKTTYERYANLMAFIPEPLSFDILDEFLANEPELGSSLP